MTDLVDTTLEQLRAGPGQALLGAHPYLSRAEFEALVADKGFDAVASAIIHRVDVLQWNRLKQAQHT